MMFRNIVYLMLQLQSFEQLNLKNAEEGNGSNFIKWRVKLCKINSYYFSKRWQKTKILLFIYNEKNVKLWIKVAQIKFI